MLAGPDWNKLYANGECLYFGVPFSDAQRVAINSSKTEEEKNELIRKFREEYLANRDIVTGEILKSAEVKEEAEQEEIAEEVAEKVVETAKKPVKAKKGK